MSGKKKKSTKEDRTPEAREKFIVVKFTCVYNVTISRAKTDHWAQACQLWRKFGHSLGRLDYEIFRSW